MKYAVYEPTGTSFDTPDRLVGIYDDLETAERIVDEAWVWQCWYIVEIEEEAPEK